MFYEVIPVRLFQKSGGILTYSSNEPLAIGQIVEIPFGKSKTFGIVSKKVSSVNFKTKPIIRKVYGIPLPKHIVKSIFWLSDYYLVPLPQVAKLFLPNGIGKKRRAIAEKAFFKNPPMQKAISKNVTAKNVISQNTIPKILLNTAQKRAINELKQIKTPTKLLHGVTGSGKTNIYLDLTKEALKHRQSVILLVPEISLTSQLVQIFQSTFAEDVVLIHSRQTEAQRHIIWENLLKSASPHIVIGPRSALLSPLSNLGLIIIDEAHESTYFQDSNPKYSALRLASYMASSLNISCIYGTATPLASDYYLAKTKKSLVTLSEKAKTTAISPRFHIINLTDALEFTKNRYFSDQLLQNIEKNLGSKRQTLVFHNRRGSAPLTICEKCGWQALCPNCFLPLTLHADSYKLICHTCGYSEKTPSSCPECHNPSIIHKGFGTKLLESELSHLFKNAKIARFDADNRKDETLDSLFSEVKNGDYDIIIGTQTIAKGLDLPHLATVGIVQADAGLSLPDYSSEEHTFHLLTQVIGRVGRGHLDAADVFIQTYQPDHPVIDAAIHNDYLHFFKHITSKRKSGGFPPFYYIAKVSVTYKTEATAIKHISSFEKLLSSNKNLRVSKPTPAFHEYSSRGYTWQIIVRAKSRVLLLVALKNLSDRAKISISLDPPSIL